MRFQATAWPRAGRLPFLGPHWGERFGRLPGPLADRLQALPRRPVWIQAVSVGEVFLARTFIKGIAEARSGEEIPVVLSSTTPAGRDTAAGTSLPGLVGVFHFPIGSPFVRRVLERVRPAALVMIETEIWPGLLKQCLQRQIPAFIVNGRLSETSRRNYRMMGPLIRPGLGAVRMACMQSQEDARRAVEIGIGEERVVVTGNMKFDAPPPARAAFDPREAFGLGPDVPVLVAGSTSPGEEEQVLAAVGGTGVFTILAPRHPDRFDEVAGLLTERSFRFIRRSEMLEGGPVREGKPQLLLLDSIGELAGMYRTADVAFVGGSLVPRGGQNMIEPAACGVPVLFGPHTRNFAAIASALLEAGGGFRVEGATSLSLELTRLMQDEVLRRRAGERAARLVASNRGATERTIKQLLPYLD